MKALATLVLFGVVGAAHAQGTLHKCIGPDGKVGYQDMPCDASARAAEIRRDQTKADPAALKKAQKDRELSNFYRDLRKLEQDNDDLRAAIAAKEEQRQIEREEDAARANARTRAIVNALRLPYDTGSYVTGPARTPALTPPSPAPRR